MLDEHSSAKKIPTGEMRNRIKNTYTKTLFTSCLKTINPDRRKKNRREKKRRRSNDHGRSTGRYTGTAPRYLRPAVHDFSIPARR